MNKTAIKNFAIWARNKLIADVSYKAGLLGITDKEIHKSAQVAQGVEFYSIDRSGALQYEVKGKEIEQRRHLADKITEKARQSDYATAYKAVIEEVAYTWFNRLIAVRFMEVNDYLPSRVRVLSSQPSVVSGTAKSEPDIVTRPFDTDLEFTAAEREYIVACKTDNKLDELFRVLFIKQCNALNALLPELFERIGDYTELLLNISFTDKDGVVWHLINDITEADFGKAVEIIGWLYQYYNTEPKDETFALLKKNVKITKERIPAATQLFTPDWIVRYMVENSLGRIFSEQWIVGSGKKFSEAERAEEEKKIAAKMGWKYYLPEAEQTPEVRVQLITNHSSLTTEFNVEEIKFLDPCMGSGHILVYAFDVFMQIYESAGYSQRDAARLILEKNIHGLDIDKRAYQLAYFALFMKARQYNRRIFENSLPRERRPKGGVVAPQVYHPAGWSDGEEYGSLVVGSEEWLVVSEKPKEEQGQLELMTEDYNTALRVWNFKRLLSQKYDVVCTNPPYMGVSGMNGKLAQFVKKNYPDSKSDLFAAFIERGLSWISEKGFHCMVTMQSWMFLSSYETMRKSIMENYTISSMIQIGFNSFPEINSKVAQAVAFTIRKKHINEYKGCYLDLTNKYPQAFDKEEAFFIEQKEPYISNADNFAKIPGSPVAYWVSASIIQIFAKGRRLGEINKARRGLETGDNIRFMRFWYEPRFIDVNTRINDVEKCPETACWVPHNKGGEGRKWYGNNVLVVWFKNKGADLLGALNGYEYYFRQGITWTALTSSQNTFRFTNAGFTFDSNKGPLIPDIDDGQTNYLLGLLNSILCHLITKILNPSLSLQNGDVDNIPIILCEPIKYKIDILVTANISLSRADWDAFETSWDFKRHPLV